MKAKYICESVPSYFKGKSIKEIVNSCTDFNKLLMLSIQNKIYELSEIILNNKNIDVNYEDALGFTPLMNSAFYGDLNATKILIEKGANIEAETISYNTPLIFAVRENNIDIVKFLLEKGANSNIVNNYGKTPLREAINKGFYEIVKLLKADITK